LDASLAPERPIPDTEESRDSSSIQRTNAITLEALLAALGVAPANVVEVWRYALTMMLIGDEGAHIIGTREQGDVLFVTVETDTGERFEVIRPAMSDDTEQLLFESIRQWMKDGTMARLSEPTETKATSKR